MSKKFLRNTMFGLITAICMTVGGFVTNLIVARFLGVSLTGTYTFAIWIVSTVTAVTGAGLPFTMARYLPEALEQSTHTQALDLATLILKPSTAFNLIPLFSSVIYAAWLWHLPGGTALVSSPLRDPVFWILVGACCSAQACADYAKGYLRGIHRLDRVAKLSSVSICLQIGCILIGTLACGIRGTLAGYLIGAIVPVFALIDLRRSKPQAPADIRERIWKFTSSRWIADMATSLVFSRIEIFFLQWVSTSISVGLLSAAMTLSNLAAMGPIMLTWGLLPHLSEKHARNDLRGIREDYCTGTRLMALMVFPACFGFAAILPELVPILFGNAFAPATHAAIALVLAASVTATMLIGNNIIWAIERTDLDVRFGAIGLTVSVCIGLPLIIKYGLAGAVAARILTQLALAAMSTGYILVKLRFPFPLRSVAGIIVSAVFCALAAKGVLIYHHGVAALGLAIACGGLVYGAAILTLRPLDKSDGAKLSRILAALPGPIAQAAERFVPYVYRVSIPPEAG